jgi:hypothetical protein
MNSVSEFEGSTAPGSANAAFCSNLSLGLHAASQPLAILRASLDSSLTDRMSKAELRQLAASSALEVERVCARLTFLKELVNTESIRSDLTATPFLPLLGYVIDGAIRLFEASEMTLSSVAPKFCQPVLIDRAKTLQVLSSVLLVAHEMSSPRDSVEIITSSDSPKIVQVIVRNLNSIVDTLDVGRHLIMILAEANIRSQQGNLSWRLSPFSVKIELKKAPAAHRQ